MMERRIVAIALIPFLLTGCLEKNEFSPAFPLGGGSGGYSAPQSPPKAPPPSQSVPKQKFGSYTHDPDQDEWAEEEESVVADSLEEAQRKCQQLAKTWGLPLDEIKAPSRKKGKLYRCIFRGYRPR